MDDAFGLLWIPAGFALMVAVVFGLLMLVTA